MKENMIVVIDYQMGNPGSVVNMLKKIGAQDVIISSELSDIQRASKLILPGVGSFDRGMESLHQLGLVDVLNEKVLHQNTPIIGICLGMHLFTKGSEEGGQQGLGWIAGKAVKFDDGILDKGLKIPHMGWNTVRLKKSHPSLCGLELDSRYYFVHSYHVCCDDSQDVLMTTSYGIEFVSAISKNSILGVQFHPEKSLRWGMNIFRNFINE